MDAVIDAFGRHRLLSFDRDPSTREPTVEIAHEALLRAWARLRGWIDEARERHPPGAAPSTARPRMGIGRPRPELPAPRDPARSGQRGGRGTRISRSAPPTAHTSTRASSGASGPDQERRREERERHVERRSRSRLRSWWRSDRGGGRRETLTLVAVEPATGGAEKARGRSRGELAAAAVAELDVDAERSILLAMEAVDTTRSVDGSVLPVAAGRSIAPSEHPESRCRSRASAEISTGARGASS